MLLALLSKSAIALVAPIVALANAPAALAAILAPEATIPSGPVISLPMLGRPPPPLPPPPPPPPPVLPPMTLTSSRKVASDAAFLASTVPTPGISIKTAIF